MIGRDYYSWGSKRHISHRYGDNQGNPYVGPIKFTFIDNKRLLVHAKNHILHIQSLDHAIEAQIHPSIRGKAASTSQTAKPSNRQRSTFLSLPQPKDSVDDGSTPLLQESSPNANISVSSSVPPSIDEIQIELKETAEENVVAEQEHLRQQQQKQEQDEEEEDWEAKILMTETNEIAQSKFSIKHTVMDSMVLASTAIYNENSIVMVDQNCRIKLFDTKKMEVVKSFGECGEHPGGILRPTSVACVSVGPHTKLILVGDSSEGGKQRTCCFTSNGEFITEFGTEGPMLGQFRDITCIAIRPLKCEKGIEVCRQLQRLRTQALLRGKGKESVPFPQAPLPNATQAPIFPEDDFVYHPYLPSWYQPTYTIEELEDSLYNDNLPNNFVVGRREYDMSLFDILFVSPEKKIIRLQAKYQSQLDIDHIIHEGNTVLTEEEKKPGFFINNRFGEKFVYPSLYELLRKNPYVKDIRIREESRDSLFFAVVDRRNYRVQLLRLFWTKSMLFSPTIEVVDVIGGIKGMHCELIDPVAIAYAPTGDLAICDAGRNGILILSPTYHLVKLLQLTFESIRDLKEAGAIAQRERERKKMEEEAMKRRRQQLAAKKSRRVQEEKLLMVKQAVKKEFDSTAIAAMTTFASKGPMSMSLTSSSVRLDTEAQLGRTTSLAKNDAGKESVAKKKPSWITFGEDGSMVVGFHSGGLYIFKPNMSLPVGKLEKLEFSILSKVILDYLTYQDVIQLRNTCRFLHDFTRELRLSYRLFPSERRVIINKVLYLFTRWARLNPDGSDNLKDRVFSDAMHRSICSYHMRLQCNIPKGKCSDSHEEVVYDRTDLQQTGAYLIYDDFLFLVGELFGPTFIYQYEVHLHALFQAYSKQQMIFQMHDGMSRANETLRERHPVGEVNVLYFRDMLELILVLEEQYCGYKDIIEHKLFSTASLGKNRRRNLPDVATNFESLSNKTAYTNILEQYSHGIDISPVKLNLGRRMITRPGFEDKVLPLHSPITTQEHVQLVQRQTERAVNFMNRMFS